VTAVGNNDPNSLVYYNVRFTAPVKPGDSIQTSIWEVGPGPNGVTELAFETKNLTTGKVCPLNPPLCAGLSLIPVVQVVLGSGVAYVNKRRGAKL
jgi:peroxisomal enoyl-CoA hydratase 2